MITFTDNINLFRRDGLSRLHVVWFVDDYQIPGWPAGYDRVQCRSPQKHEPPNRQRAGGTESVSVLILINLINQYKKNNVFTCIIHVAQQWMVFVSTLLWNVVFGFFVHQHLLIKINLSLIIIWYKSPFDHIYLGEK